MNDSSTFPAPQQSANPDATQPQTAVALDKTLIEQQSTAQAAYKIASRCETGAVRERNEDACLIFTTEAGGHFPLTPLGLYVVADGMGGHMDGHLASSTATRVAADHLLQHVMLPLLRNGAPPENDALQAAMQAAVQAAHQAVYESNPAGDGGTTLTAALVVGQRLFLAHVGDSRAYWLVNGRLEALTNDHSLVQRLQDVGQLTAEEAHRYQYRNVLLRALGQEDELKVDTAVRNLPASGKLLVCSDGLWGFIGANTLERIMLQPTSPQNIINQLYEAAMASGGYDNITGIVVEFSL